MVQTDTTPSHRETDSLAYLYLDTRNADDGWRSDCLKIIRHFTKQRCALKPHNTAIIHTNMLSKSRSKSNHCKLPSRGLRLPCPSASSPQPSNLTTYLHSRSLRSHPILNHTTIASIDGPASTLPRTCLSCKIPTTTCWRRAMRGFLCNGCGLRSMSRHMSSWSQVQEMRDHLCRWEMSSYSYRHRDSGIKISTWTML